VIEDPDDVVYVHWRGGIWKVVPDADSAWADRSQLKIRWVRGYKPDEGVFQIVRPWDTTVLTAMEVLGLMADDEVVP
jgi:hypothetical protein